MPRAVCADISPVREPSNKPQAQVLRDVVARVLGRDRDGSASSLDRAVGEAAALLLASSSSDGRAETLRACDELAHRGDEPGARLLLRAVSRVAPDRALSEAASRLRPRDALRRHVLLAAVLLWLGLFVGALVVMVLAGADEVAAALLAGSVGPVLAVRLAWTRHVRVPGLTLQESQLWRSLGVLRPGDTADLSLLGDGRLRRAMSDLGSSRGQPLPSAFGQPDISGWVGLAAVTGAVLGLVGGLAIPSLPSGTFLALMPVGAVVAAVAVRAALLRARAGAGRRPSR